MSKFATFIKNKIKNKSKSLSLIEEWRRGEKFIPSEREIDIDKSQLNPEQLEVLSLVERQCKLSDSEFFQNPLRLILTGSQGTGKSITLHHILQHLEDIQETRPDFGFMAIAPTATAAINIQGRTCHSALKLTKYSGDLYEAGRKLLNNSCEPCSVRVIVIDEMSLLGLSMFYYIDQFFRKSDPQYKDIPFAGRSVILAGDIWQMKPVNNLSLFEPLPKLYKHEMPLTKEVYQSFQTVRILKTPNRQSSKDQSHFRELLYRLSRREATPADVDLLNSRVLWNLPEEEQLQFDDAVHLFARNKHVNLRNLTKMKAVNEKIIHLPRVGMSPSSSPICVGARVILSTNLWFDGRLCNGSKGTVLEIKFNSDAPEKNELPLYVLVNFDDYMGTELYTSSAGLKGVPIVPFKDNVSAKLPGGGYENREVIYIPLQGAYGSTVHKAQALTLPKVGIFFGKYELFTGSDFVSCSRVKSLQDLVILDNKIEYKRLVYDNAKNGKNEFFQAQLAEQARLQELAELSK